MVQRVLAVVVLLGAFMLVGCKSSPTKETAAGGMPGVVTAGPTTYVYVPGGNSGPGQVIAYSTSGKTCPQCDEDVKAYFLTGKPLDPVCKTCGATRTIQTVRTELLPGNVK